MGETFLKTCSICKDDKLLNQFYSQEKHSNKRGNYLYYQPYCKDCASMKSQKWLNNNADSKKESSLKYYKSEKGKKNYLRKTHRQKENGYSYFREYQKKNLEKFRNYNQKRRATERELICNFSQEDWKACLKFFNYCCSYCGMSQSDCQNKFKVGLQQEHVIPVTSGGDYTNNNIIPACKSCNSSKNDKEILGWYRQKDFYSLERERRVFFYLSQFDDRNRGELIG